MVIIYCLAMVGLAAIISTVVVFIWIAVTEPPEEFK